MIEFINDPIQVCIVAFNSLYPSKKIYIQYDNRLINEKKQCYVSKLENSEFIIGLNPIMPINDIYLCLCEMLAHLIEGSMEENKKWEAILNNIKNTINQIYLDQRREFKIISTVFEYRNDLN